MLDQRQRRWAYAVQMLSKSFVFARQFTLLFLSPFPLGYLLYNSRFLIGRDHSLDESRAYHPKQPLQTFLLTWQLILLINNAIIVP